MITEFTAEFRAFKSKAEHLFRAIEPDEGVIRPAPAKWSIQECFEHLSRTGYLYLNKAWYVMENPPEIVQDNVACTYRRHIRWFIWLMEPPYRWKLRAPKSFRPTREPKMDRLDKTLEQFINLQNQFIKLIDNMQERDTLPGRITSPLTKWLDFTPCEFFAAVAAHQRRHLWQAEKTLQAVRRITETSVSD